MSQLVTIGNGQLTAIIAAKGAEIQSLVPADGRDVMWTGDADVWPWHAPNLFPIVGALANDELVHDGQRYPMKQHGFLRQSLCEVLEAGPEACAFRLVDNADTHEQYPYAFALTISYRVEGDRLEATFSRTQATCIMKQLDEPTIRALDRSATLPPDSDELTTYSNALTACVLGFGG